MERSKGMAVHEEFSFMFCTMVAVNVVTVVGIGLLVFVTLSIVRG